MLALLWSVLSLSATLLAQSSSEAEVTFNRDIAPIVSSRCVSCHQPDGDAPFSLATYQDVRRRGGLVVAATRAGYMPPWKPEPGFAEFLGDRHLTEREIALFERWWSTGAIEGDTPLNQIVPTGLGGWKLGTPDLVLALPSFTLRPDGSDVFRNFVLPLGGRRARYVRALEFRPHNKAVHHANIRIDRTRASRVLDDEDPGPGYEGLILHSAEYPDGHFLGWTPGQPAPVASPDLSWTLEPDSDLVIQMHMQPTGKPETITAAVGIYFTDLAPSRLPVIIRLGRQSLDIPPGTTSFASTDSFTLPVDVEVHAIQPHAHNRARSAEAWATLADGSRRPLIRIGDWDFRWQDQYRYARPFWLPAGTRIDIKYVFDNSAGNPRNPDVPPQRVTWGWRTSDEMADVWLQVFTRAPADRVTLMREAGLKMSAEDVVGGEMLIARDPRHISLRNDTALAYLTLGQPDDAARHFAAVTALVPQSAEAHYNEGVALEAGGHFAEAARQYETAVSLNPRYAKAFNNLGSVLAKQGDTQGATTAYRRALEVDPANVETHTNLGGLLVLTAPADAVTHLQQALATAPAYPDALFNLARAQTILGQPREAIASYRAALTARADWVPSLINLSWLLSAHADPSLRNPSEAVDLAERAVAQALGDATALDALAAALAAAGRYEEAVAAASSAKAAATTSGLDRLAGDIEARIALYRRRTAFVVAP